MQAKVKDFVVNITKLTRAVNQRGFGLILVYDTEHDREYALYDNISAVSEAFPVGSKAYKIASRIFGQNPKPQQIAIVGNTHLDETAGTNAVFTMTVNTKFEAGDTLYINGVKYSCVTENANIDKNEFLASNMSDELIALKRLVEKYEDDFSVSVTQNTLLFTQKIPGQEDIPDVKASGTGKVRPFQVLCKDEKLI